MVMENNKKRKQEIEEFGKWVSLARKPSELMRASRVLGSDTYGVRAMVSFRLYDPDCGFSVFPTNKFVVSNYIVPYFAEGYVYLIQHDMILRPSQMIDHTVTLDSNFATYVDSIVRAKSLKALTPEVMQVFDVLLRQDVNFDSMLYWLENIKQVRPVVLRMRENGTMSPLEFWKSLKKGFRQNAVSLTLFRDVDCAYYRRTGMLKFDASYIRAVRDSIDFCFKFYGSDEGNELISELVLPMQRSIIILLLVMLRIQFSSNEGSRKKTRKFLDIMQNEMVYLDRETVIAYRYFKDRSSVSFLEVVNPGGKQRDLLRKIENLAWDMTWPRYAEWFIANSGQGDYLMLFFLSFDRKLRELLGCYKVKAAVIDRERRILMPIPKFNTYEYFKKEGFRDFAEFFSEEKKKERESTTNRGLRVLESRILKQYRELRTSLGWR